MTDKLTVRRFEGVTVLEATGELTLRDKVLQAMAAGSTQILLNMAGMNRIDSFGIGELIGAYTSVVKAGGQMKLVNAVPQVQQMLFITKLCTVFEIFEDEAIAVRSFTDSQPLERIVASSEARSEMFLG